ncbi:MAG: aldo/keto reductase [Candidatus Latescibacterota bacterium]
MKRRNFVKTTALGAAAAATGYSATESGKPSPDNMKYSILGKTGLKVSRLAFGSHLNKQNIADPTGRDKQIQFGIEMGINFFDIYEHSYSQYLPMSKSLRNHPHALISLYMEAKAEEVEKRVDEVLRLFGRERIDCWRTMTEGEEYRKLDELLRMKAKGKIRAVGIAHHWEEAFVQAIKKYGDDLDYLMFPYNFVHNRATPNDKQNSYAGFLRLAKQHNYGLIGMKPFCNEMLVDFAKENGFIGGPKDRGVSVPAAAIRYALSTGVIHCSLPAMNSIAEITENLQGVYRPKLTEKERNVLDEIDLLAMEKKWAYLEKKPRYAWLANWAQRGV